MRAVVAGREIARERSCAALAGVGRRRACEDHDGQASIELRTTDAQATLIALLDLAQRQQVTLTGLSTSQATLEDVFLARTGHRYDGDE